jgi:protein-S-isoprenylcysteine O-methyltransferase Ste14
MSTLFPSLLDEILFWVIFGGGTAALHAWAGVVLGISKAGGERQRVKNKGTEPYLQAIKASSTNLPKRNLVAMLSLFLFGIIVVPILVGYARLGVLPSYLFYPGLVIMIVGFAIYYWGVLALGHFPSGFVRVIPDHKVIQRGPYRFVRHPLYASEILSFIGLGLALQSWVSLIIILIGAGVFYSIKIRIEEKFLAAELGDEYVQYMKSVKRIVPHIL